MSDLDRQHDKLLESSPPSYDSDSHFTPVQYSHNYQVSYPDTQPQRPPSQIPPGYPYAIPNLIDPTTNTTWSSVNYISTNPIHPTKYPKSSKLLQELCEKFGPHNIVPPPDFLTTDKQRSRWLKRDHNALLYFLHRKPKYQREIQQILDYPACCVLCSPSPSSFSVSTCQLCCLGFMESFLCYNLCWIGARGSKRALYSGDLPTPNNESCCPVFCGGVALRQELVQRLQRSGMRISEDECSSCLQLCFCLPCVSMQVAKIIDVALNQRYGKLMEAAQFSFSEVGSNSNLAIYYKNAQDSTQHPYSRAQRCVEQEYADEEYKPPQVRTGERTILLGAPSADLFSEYYDVQQAITAHNQYWEGIHQISGLDMK